MKPNTRLLIRLSFADGSMKGWGYDYSHYKTSKHIHDAIAKDFTNFPTTTEIRLFYYNTEKTVTANDASELADKAIQWLNNLGTYNG